MVVEAALLALFVAVACRWRRVRQTLTGDAILSMGPPRATGAAATGAAPNADSLKKALMRIAERHISEHGEKGLSICVYHRGVEVANVVAGVHRTSTSSWAPVLPSTLFMGYSVAKGVSATAALTAVDRKELSYDESVAKRWQAFGAHEKATVTVAEALSHRAGLPHNPPVLRLLAAYARGGADEFKASGVAWIEGLQPQWLPGSKAKYHAVSWSWLVIGIVTVTTGRRIGEIVQESIADVLAVPRDLFLGTVPLAEWPRIATLEHMGAGGGGGSSLLFRAIACVESTIFTTIGSCSTWKKLCLPSSNGFMTAQAVARMYGALAHQGSLSDGSRLVDPATIEDLSSRAFGAECVITAGVESSRADARLACGFYPWVDESLHGHAKMLGHRGMGGCFAFADMERGTGVAALKTAYSPLALQAAGTSLFEAEVTRAVHAYVG